MNGDVTNVPFFPGNGGKLRQLWNDVCFDVMEQTGRSVVYYLEGYADAHRAIPEERLKRMHFITLTCEESVLWKRVCEKWGDSANKIVPGTDKTWPGGKTWGDMAVLRNQYFKIYHDEHEFPNMVLIDTTDRTVDEAANQVEAYIQRQMDLCEQSMKPTIDQTSETTRERSVDLWADPPEGFDIDWRSSFDSDE